MHTIYTLTQKLVSEGFKALKLGGTCGGGERGQHSYTSSLNAKYSSIFYGVINNHCRLIKHTVAASYKSTSQI